MATPPGWAKDTSNENIFSTTIPAKVQRTGSGGQRTSRNRSFTNLKLITPMDLYH